MLALISRKAPLSIPRALSFAGRGWGRDQRCWLRNPAADPREEPGVRAERRMREDGEATPLWTLLRQREETPGPGATAARRRRLPPPRHPAGPSPATGARAGGTWPVLSPHPERCSVFTNGKDRRCSAGHQTKPPRHPRLVQTASGRRPRSSNEVCDRKQRHRDNLNAVRAAGQLADLCNLQNIIKCGHVRLVFWPRRLISSGDGDTPAPSPTTATLPGSPQAAPALACSRSRDRVTSDTQFSRHLAAAT